MKDNNTILEKFYLKHVMEKLGEEFKKRIFDADDDFDLELALDEFSRMKTIKNKETNHLTFRTRNC